MKRKVDVSLFGFSLIPSCIGIIGGIAINAPLIFIGSAILLFASLLVLFTGREYYFTVMVLLFLSVTSLFVHGTFLM